VSMMTQTDLIARAKAWAAQDPDPDVRDIAREALASLPS